MDIHDLILSAPNKRPIHLLINHFELTPYILKRVLHYVVPYLGDAVIRTMKTPQGLASFLEQLASDEVERDLRADNIFQDPRVHSNGTRLLSLLLRNEATIRVVAAIGAEGAGISEDLVRRMMPYIASLYMDALATKSRAPMRRLANRVDKNNLSKGHGAGQLVQLVLQASSTKANTRTTEPSRSLRHGSIKDILNSLSNMEKDGYFDQPARVLATMK